MVTKKHKNVIPYGQLIDLGLWLRDKGAEYVSQYTLDELAAKGTEHIGHPVTRFNMRTLVRKLGWRPKFPPRKTTKKTNRVAILIREVDRIMRDLGEDPSDDFAELMKKLK